MYLIFCHHTADLDVFHWMNIQRNYNILEFVNEVQTDIFLIQFIFSYNLLVLCADTRIESIMKQSKISNDASTEDGNNLDKTVDI